MSSMRSGVNKRRRVCHQPQSLWLLRWTERLNRHDARAIWIFCFCNDSCRKFWDSQVFFDKNYSYNSQNRRAQNMTRIIPISPLMLMTTYTIIIYFDSIYRYIVNQIYLHIISRSSYGDIFDLRYGDIFDLRYWIYDIWFTIYLYMESK